MKQRIAARCLYAAAFAVIALMSGHTANAQETFRVGITAPTVAAATVSSAPISPTREVPAPPPPALPL
jgi:hypothetical protein